MAFKGDLKNVHLADLFQTLSQNQQEGVLTLSLSGETRRIHFGADGLTLLDPLVASRRRLGDILVSAGLISEDDLTIALKEQSRSPRFLGEILIQQGKLTDHELKSILQVQIEEEFYNLFRINQGLFEFREEEPCEAPLPHMVPFQVDGIVFEAARRMDEWQVIQKHVPDLARVYLAVQPDAPVSDEETQLVLGKLDGRRSVQDTADSLLSSPFAVAKVMASLIDAGAVREAEPQELLDSARQCLDEGNEHLARKLLTCLRSMNGLTSEPLLDDLASMLREAGDGRAAAQVRLRIARQARDREDLITARTNLQSALQDQPDSTAILSRLGDVYRDLGDPEAELECLKRLGALHGQSGDPEDAIRCFERVLKLEPNQPENYRRLADVCLRARLKDRAVEVLEDQVEVLKRAGLVRDLPGVFQRILDIDSSRSDIRRQMSRMKRSRSERVVRASIWMVALVIVLGLSASYYLQKRERRLGMQELDSAMVLVQSNDLKRARSMLQETLNTYPENDVVVRATRMLDQIDTRLTEEVRKERTDLEFALDGKLATLQRDIDAGRFAAAVTGLLELHENEKEAYLRKRIVLRLRACADAVAEQVSRADEVAFQYHRPESDHDVEPAYLRIASAFPADTGDTISALRDATNRALLEADDDTRPVLESILKGASAWGKSHGRMETELRALEQKYGRLRTLHRISGQYLIALEAANAGDLERALVLFRGVVEDYGDGGLQDHLRERIARIEHALSVSGRLQELLASGQVEKAHQVAVEAVTDYQDLNLGRTLKIPLVIRTVPPGADVMQGPQKLGSTPLVLQVDWAARPELRLYHPDFAVQTLTLDPNQGAYDVELVKESLLRLNLGVALEVPPMVHDECFYVASRDGVLTRINPRNLDNPTTRFETGSLSGSRTRPVSTSRGLVYSVLEGKLWMLATDQPELTALWSKRFEAEIRVEPISADGELLVLLNDNTLISLQQKDGSEQWRLSLGPARVVAAPILGGRLLYIPRGRTIEAFDRVTRKVVFSRDVGEDLHGSPSLDGDLLIVTTITGDVVAMNKRTGELLGRTRTRDLPKGDAVAHHGVVDLSLGDRVVRIDPLAQKVIHTWGPGLPLSGAPTVMGGGALLIGGKDGYLYGLDPDTDAPEFRTPVSTTPVLGQAALSDQFIAVLTEDGTLRIFKR